MKKLYIPNNLKIEEILKDTPYSDPKHYDKFYYLIHLIYEQRTLYRLEEEYVPLKAIYLRNILKGYNAYRDLLMDKGIIGSDLHYIKGRKSYGYKLLGEYADAKVMARELKNKAIIRNLEKWKARRLPTTEVYQHLYDFLNKVEIDYDGAKEYINTLSVQEYNAAMIAIDKFKEKDFFMYKDDFGNRVHTNITNLKSELRRFLTYKGKKLINVDIANSQPLIFLLTIPSSIRCTFFEDIERYKELVEKGKLYEYMMEELQVKNRSEFKERFFRDIFFGKKVSNYFWQLFPNIAKLLAEIKKEDYRKVAWMMQREEADIIINRICRRIMKEAEGLFISTIHDSILTVEDGKGIVVDIISEEFKKLDIVPKIRIES